MYTRFIEFYRFDLSGDGIHTLNYIVSGSLDLDHPAVLSLADRQDIRRIGSRHDSQAVSAMDGFNMITAHNNRKLFTFIDKGGPDAGLGRSPNRYSTDRSYDGPNDPKP